MTATDTIAERLRALRLPNPCSDPMACVDIVLPEALEAADAIDRLTSERDELKKALKVAEQFIVNGVEFGYIRMPDESTPDSAHDTLPMIRSALDAANKEGK